MQWLVLVPWLRFALGLLITCCFLAFALWSYSVWDPWYQKKAPWNDYEDNPTVNLNYHALIDRYKDLGADIRPIYYSSLHVTVRSSAWMTGGGCSQAPRDYLLRCAELNSTSAQLIFTLGSTLLAAVCTIALRSLPTLRAKPEEQMTGLHGAIRKSWLQVASFPAAVLFARGSKTGYRVTYNRLSVGKPETRMSCFNSQAYQEPCQMLALQCHSTRAMINSACNDLHTFWLSWPFHA